MSFRGQIRVTVGVALTLFVLGWCIELFIAPERKNLSLALVFLGGFVFLLGVVIRSWQRQVFLIARDPHYKGPWARLWKHRIPGRVVKLWLGVDDNDLNVKGRKT